MRTSHKSHVRRFADCLYPVAAVALFAVVLLGSGSAIAQEKLTQELPAAEKILDKAIDAVGGKEAFEKLTNRVSKGTIEIVGMGVKGPIEIYEAAPSSMYVVLEMEGIGREEAGGDGKVHWHISTSMGPRLLEGDELAAAARDSVFNADLHWRKLYKTVECVAKEDVNGRPCYKVVLTPPVGHPQTVYYERKTGLAIRLDTVATTLMGDMPTTAEISDYRKVDGVLLPHKILQDVGGVQKLLITTTSVEHNVTMPADRFEPPASIKALLKKAADKGKDKP